MEESKNINVLLYDTGSLGNSLIRNFCKSKLLSHIYLLNCDSDYKEKVVFTGYGKTTKIGEHKKFIKENNIDFVIVNSENYLYGGIIDMYKKIIKLPAIGAIKQWFFLEASKSFCKNFMVQNDIKTPEYTIIYNENLADDYIKKFGLPIVIKDNNLKAGFGSYICYTKWECKKRVKELLKKTKDNPFPFCIVEKFVKGSEISVHFAWDGNELLAFLPVKDFKPFKGKGKVLNTGGMGSFAPAFLSERQKVMLENYINKLKDLFTTLKPDFTGIFVVNLLFTDDELYTLEFNMRPGITEFETLIELFDFDLLEFFYNLATHQLNKCKIKYKENLYSGCITVVDKSFYKQKDKIIKLPLKKLLPANENKLLINKHFAPPDERGNVLVNKKDKFYTVVNTDFNNPFNGIYAYLKNVNCANVYYRKDIGEIYAE